MPPYEEVIPKELEKEEKLLFKEHLVSCPKCGSTRTMTTAYRKEFEAFECLSCHNKWKEEITNSTERPYGLLTVQSKIRKHKVRNAILLVSIGMILLIVFVLFIGPPDFNFRRFLGKRAPVASFISSKNTDIFVGEAIIFNASSSYDPDDTREKRIINYKWDFGDGKPIQTVASHSVTHSYGRVGKYNVTLTVIDDEEQNATFTSSIEVQWEVPSFSQLSAWLIINITNQVPYQDPDFVCFDFAKMLANHSRQENWKIALVILNGSDTATKQSWYHAINAINTTEGLVYIEPQTDEAWWYSDHEPIVSGNTYKFWIIHTKVFMFTYMIF